MAPLSSRSKKSFRSEKRRFAKPVARLFSIGALLALSVSGTYAATLEFDPGLGTTTTGTGPWDLTTANWYNGSTDVVWPNSGTDVAQFGNTTALNGGATEIGGTATTAAAIQVNQIVFTLAGYTIANGAGGSLTLSGTTPTINSTVPVTGTGAGVDTISAAMGGTAGLTKTGVGTVVLSGANTYTGTTTIAGGTLQLGAAAATLGAAPAVAFTSTGGALNLGGNTATLATLTSAGTTGTSTNTVTGGDGLVLGANSFSFAPAATANSAISTLDMSGLTSFAYNQAAAGQTFAVTVQGNQTANTVLNLAAGTNTITATNFSVGVGGGSVGGVGTLALGATNTINTATIQLGGYRSFGGTVQYQTGLTNPTLTLRGVAGGTSAVTLATIGLPQSGGSTNTALFDTSAGSVNGIVNSLVLAQIGTASVGPATSTNAGTFRMQTGTLNTGTITLSAVTSTITTAVSAITNAATFTQNAGAVLADGIVFNSQSAGTGTGFTETNNYNLGTATTTAVLSAGSVSIGANLANAAGRSTINFNNGTITNYDNTANGFAGQGNANGSTTTNVQNLTLAGTTGGGAVASNATLNIVLAATGTHNFLAEAGSTITQGATSIITGTGALTANGAGTVTLGGANTYSGGTNVTAGMLTVAANSALGTGNVTLSASTQLNISAGVTITNMTGTTLTLNSATNSIVDLLGTANTVQDSVNTLVINGITQQPGTYGALGSGAAFTSTDFAGTGQLLVAVPEPSVWAFMAGGFGLVGLALRRRRQSC